MLGWKMPTESRVQEDELRNRRKAAELSSEVSSQPGEATALPSSVTLASVPSVVGPAAQIIGFYNFTIECGIWLLIIMALTPVFSTDHLSPPGTDSSRTCARLCRRDFVLHKYLLFISSIRKRLAYERHLSTYLPSNRDRRYYSKRLQFVSPHATRPTYKSPDSP